MVVVVCWVVCGVVGVGVCGGCGVGEEGGAEVIGDGEGVKVRAGSLEGGEEGCSSSLVRRERRRAKGLERMGVRDPLALSQRG